MSNDEKQLPPVVHTLNDLSFASANLRALNGDAVPMFRMMLTVDRQDASGQTQNIHWPDLFLEPHVADAMCQAIRIALAKYHPDYVQSQELERNEKKSSH